MHPLYNCYEDDLTTRTATSSKAGYNLVINVRSIIGWEGYPDPEGDISLENIDEREVAELSHRERLLAVLVRKRNVNNDEILSLYEEYKYQPDRQRTPSKVSSAQIASRISGSFNKGFEFEGTIKTSTGGVFSTDASLGTNDVVVLTRDSNISFNGPKTASSDISAIGHIIATTLEAESTIILDRYDDAKLVFLV